MNKQQTIDALHEGPTAITFIKKDETMRTMKATLKEQFLPEQTDVEEHVQKKSPNPNVCVVYDLEKQGWRSFRWDSLKIVNGYQYENNE